MKKEQGNSPSEAGDRFNWVPVYMNMAEELQRHRDDPALLDFFIGASGNDALRCTDPFSLFATFNKGQADGKRRQLILALQEVLGLPANAPEGFDGIPTVMAQKAWFRGKSGDEAEDAKTLWDLLDHMQEYADNPCNEAEAAFAALFDRALEIRNVGVRKLTIGLYWMRPDFYLPLDGNTAAMLGRGVGMDVEPAKLDGAAYASLLAEARGSIAIPFWEFSAAAYESKDGWFPLSSSYEPDLDIEDWLALLKDDEVTTEGALVALACLRNFDADGATCVELTQTYGRNPGYYNSQVTAFAKRVHDKTGCVLEKRRDGSEVRWSLPCLGQDAAKDRPGTFVWRLRDELRAALDQFDLSTLALHASGEEDPLDERHFWWINANAEYWSWNSLEVGDSIEYESLNQKGNKRQKYKYFTQAKAGDMVIGYHTHPLKEIACLGEVVGGLTEDGFLPIRKVAEAVNKVAYDDIKAREGLEELEYVNSGHTGTIFAVRPEEFDILVEMMGLSENGGKASIHEETASAAKPDPYGRDNFLEDVFMDGADYDRLVRILLRKKNVILQGSPGTGKTYAARRLAWSILGAQDDSSIKAVQFHQSTCYEDMVAGLRPDSCGGFSPQYGAFARFCKEAEGDSGRPWFFIIDEINRANISKVFGELLMLIEADHRGEEVLLPVTGEPFSVPANVHIIGMMNTADRGLALIDYALRRRFAFFEMEPALRHPGFAAKVAAGGNSKLEALVDAVVKVNEDIADDASLGRGFRIGHSYFCLPGEGPVSDEVVADIVDFELIPLIDEYWFDDEDAAAKQRKRLREAIG